ncbi:D-alanyl-D-alanine carboxypeptidase/D-alanyl-D-alanine endopeptidase [Bacillus changyiensis]|uniref:D-alanyl-D-alanine carboxypeptidase/D-alanyl-D-alanine endopeptidase n=1 Tax=Bacillus changyiensis TaxID=3004103 RepID=UPI0022E5C01D|nr:D-alanyl-D-alanine carboxypeptidase/D-alanyl-D-alanine-endopeptidase [Bacillus changyiensis]MDA1475144.1 D-alanyl-D-alanine carboxypeptidase/D-alanyl-D-alanine-endopeptidase [Bacillus changyiensis]
MTKNLKASLCIFMLFVFAFISGIHENKSASATNNRISDQIDPLLKHDPLLQGTLAGISIRSASSGEILYSHLGDIRLRPASNLKLLTAAAALSVLGEDYSFQTEVLTDGHQIGNSLKGDLYLKGKGDPTLLAADFKRIAEKIRKKGITTIFGNLIGDDSWYDDVRYSADLTWDDEDEYYGAQVSALTASPNEDYDAGTVILEISPGRLAGQKPKVTLQPQTNQVKIMNNAKTVTAEEKKKINIERLHGTNIIEMNGTIPKETTKIRKWVALWKPSHYALDLFKQALHQQGIHMIGTEKIGVTPKQAKRITVHQSIPLAKLMIPFMKLSNNGHAETLVKEMGKTVKHEGSWEKGLEVLNTTLDRLGLHTNQLLLRDGSGISHLNSISADQITKLLYVVQGEKWFSTYIRSLPVGGNSDRMVGGTLRNRFKNPLVKGKVRAKTGTLATVSSLSGYVDTKSGKTLIFSIILNQLMDEDKGKDIEDKLVEILAAQ